MLLFFSLTGLIIFAVLGLTIHAFKIAGGILLVSFPTWVLTAKKEVYFPEELENIAVVPLAFPLTCGAGTITVVILISSQAVGILEKMVGIGAGPGAIAGSFTRME